MNGTDTDADFLRTLRDHFAADDFGYVGDNREWLGFATIVERLTLLAERVEALRQWVGDTDARVAAALLALRDNVHSGIYRPGSWERPWLEQALGTDDLDDLLDGLGIDPDQPWRLCEGGETDAG